ncbi:MAG: hypothetical protein ACLFQ0_19585, partial [Cyclobacteriaceae bacterium]
MYQHFIALVCNEDLVEGRLKRPFRLVPVENENYIIASQISVCKIFTIQVLKAWFIFSKNFKP